MNRKRIPLPSAYSKVIALRRRLLSTLLTGALLLSLAACGKVDSGDARALTIAMGKDENTLTPFTYVSSTGLTVNRLIYDTLFTTDTENNVIPWMVGEDYTVSPDATVYEMRLLPGQRFHDGTPLTAADVAFTFAYCKTQNQATLRRIANWVDAVEVVGEDSLRFVLAAPNINFLRDGLCVMRILSKAQYEGLDDGAQVNGSVGSGMYRLAQYKPGQFYELTAVSDYFRGNPTVDTLRLPIIEDASAVQQALLSGEVAAATASVGVEVLDVFRAKAGMEVYASPGYAPVMMNMNADRISPIVRKAISLAIDVNSIMETLYGAYATVGTRALVRKDLPYAVDGLDYRYDPAAANLLLEEAGYTTRDAGGTRSDVNDKSLSFTLLVYAGNTQRTRMAELISQQLKAVGIFVTVKAMEMDTVDAYVWPDFDVSNGRDYDLAMWGWGSSLSPTYLIDLCAGDFALGGDNLCGYRNEAFDAQLATRLPHITTMAQMEELLGQLQTLVAEDPPLISLGFADSLQVCNTNLYDGWQTMKGGNVVNLFSFLPR